MQRTIAIGEWARGLLTEAHAYLDESCIPFRHSEPAEYFNLEITEASRRCGCAELNGSAGYRAVVFLPHSGNRIGEFYFPMHADRSYRLVIQDGLEKLNGMNVNDKLEPLIEYSSSLTSAKMSEAWKSMSESDASMTIACLSASLIAKLQSDSRAESFKLENIPDFEAFRKKLEDDARHKNHDACGLIAAGETEVKRAYDNQIRVSSASIDMFALGSDQIRVIKEVITNLANYEFYLNAAD